MISYKLRNVVLMATTAMFAAQMASASKQAVQYMPGRTIEKMGGKIVPTDHNQRELHHLKGRSMHHDNPLSDAEMDTLLSLERAFESFEKGIPSSLTGMNKSELERQYRKLHAEEQKRQRAYHQNPNNDNQRSLEEIQRNMHDIQRAIDVAHASGTLFAATKSNYDLIRK